MFLNYYYSIYIYGDSFEYVNLFLFCKMYWDFSEITYSMCKTNDASYNYEIAKGGICICRDSS